MLVTGTNGKTTTTRLITAALGALGQEVASNAFGANMEAGLAAALGQAPDAPLAVLEVDEQYLPAVLSRPPGRGWSALLNLSRDQMDRAAEIWLVAGGGARRWRPRPDCRVVANADDPLIAWARCGGADMSPGWRPASAGTRTRGAARSAARTCSAMSWAGAAASATSPVRPPGGCLTAAR